MARHFNGVYSVRAGSRGAKQSSNVSINSDVWKCEKGHINPKFELVDERSTGGSVHRTEVTTCKQCAAQQSVQQTACPVPHPQQDFEFICDLCGEHVPARH